MGVISIILFLFGCSNNKDSQTGQNELQDDIGNPIVYLGNEDSPNEILFIFDYECPYCHEWIEEHFSTMKKWANNGDIKFRTQSMAWLNENSFKLSTIDQNLKLQHPESYFDIFVGLMKEKPIENLLAKYDIDLEEVSKEPRVNIVTVTDHYSAEFDLQYVPTVIVNGQKVQDPFSLDEIQSYMND